MVSSSYTIDLSNIKNEIRELLKLIETKNVISLAGGLPNKDTFPKEELKRIFEKCSEKYDNFLQYGPTEGIVKCREAIANFLKLRHLNVPLNQLIITTGSQQALEIIFKLFGSKDITIYVENPTYVGALNCIKLNNNPIETIPCDDKGIIIEEFENMLKNKKSNFGLVYTVPTFQNPAGFCMPNERRKQLVELANKYNLLILEDEPYAFLNYTNEQFFPIKYYDKNDKVIYTCSFSKIFCPGFRLGAVFCQDDILKKIVTLKQTEDLQSSSIGQFILAEYLMEGRMEEHIKEVIKFNRSKRDLMAEVLKKYLPQAEWVLPKGGLFFWIRLKGINTSDLLNKCIDKGVAFLPGDSFFAKRDDKEHIRLNFSYAKDEEIVEGIKRIAEVVSKLL